jgi:hypothetical protein
VQDQHTEVSRRSSNLFSVTEVAARIGADLETVTDWVEIGAIDRAVFGGGRFSKNELLRAALVFELVKFGLSSSCARDIVREMEYDLQQNLGRNPASLQSLRNSNSNEREVVGFLVLDETRSRNRLFFRRGSNYSARFRYPGPCD